MDKFEPKETGLKRTLWLFEREILVNLEKTDLKDHHKVLSFNIFSMEYELNPEFDNGRADAIVMRDTANHWLKMWFVAFQTCASEKMQSLQAEINQLQLQINEMAEVGLSQESAIREKNKRIEQLQAKVDAVEHVLGCAMIAPKEVFQYADRIGRALRGEHE